MFIIYIEVSGLSSIGSEMIGALLAGWEYAQGIELSAEYAEIAEARLRYWTKQPTQKEMEL